MTPRPLWLLIVGALAAVVGVGLAAVNGDLDAGTAIILVIGGAVIGSLALLLENTGRKERESQGKRLGARLAQRQKRPSND